MTGSTQNADAACSQGSGLSLPAREDLLASLERVFSHTRSTLASKPEQALPDPARVRAAVSQLQPALQETGRSVEDVTEHLLALTAGLSNSSLSSTYYGFVTGGATPWALLADLLAVLHDQNCAVHLPDQSVAANVEARALAMLLDLLRLDRAHWTCSTLTTGATAGNIQGLACGREAVLQKRLSALARPDSAAGEGEGQGQGGSVAQLGLLEACRRAGVHEIRVLTTGPHSSLVKAASILGLGRGCVIDVRKKESMPTAKTTRNNNDNNDNNDYINIQDISFDWDRLQEELAVPGRASIVSVSCGEVNTGNHATYSYDEMKSLRELCDQYNAWLHVDGAFGIFTRLLNDSGPEFKHVAAGGAGMELADSIAGDLHKFLNVPYDCGFFVSRHADVQSEVYQNVNASYLKTVNDGIPSALNIGAENSRRFRGFAVYSTLLGLGRVGYARIMEEQVRFSRAVAAHIDANPALELLNGNWTPEYLSHRSNGSLKSGWEYTDIATIVLFAAKDDDLNVKLLETINLEKTIYVSGTSWRGRPACRIAVSNWQCDRSQDLTKVCAILDKAVRSG